MKPAHKIIAGAALVGSTLAGGAIGATLINPASAATPTTSASTATTAPATDSARPAIPEHGTAAHEDQEKAVTGDAATKAQAAAVKSVGSGTAGDVTTDFTGQGYEVTVTKADGTQVEVHLDSSFTVMQGHGPGGDHGGPGAPAPSSSSGSSSTAQ